MFILRKMANHIFAAVIGHILCDDVELSFVFQVTVIENDHIARP